MNKSVGYSLMKFGAGLVKTWQVPWMRLETSQLTGQKVKKIFNNFLNNYIQTLMVVLVNSTTFSFLFLSNGSCTWFVGPESAQFCLHLLSFILIEQNLNLVCLKIQF